MKKVFLILSFVAFIGAVQAKPVAKKSTEQEKQIATSYEHSLL
jgi:hypothetical protein